MGRGAKGFRKCALFVQAVNLPVIALPSFPGRWGWRLLRSCAYGAGETFSLPFKLALTSIMR